MPHWNSSSLVWWVSDWYMFVQTWNEISYIENIWTCPYKGLQLRSFGSHRAFNVAESGILVVFASFISVFFVSLWLTHCSNQDDRYTYKYVHETQYPNVVSTSNIFVQCVHCFAIKSLHMQLLLRSVLLKQINNHNGRL